MSSAISRLAVLVGALVAISSSWVAPACADVFGGISLLSAGPFGQAEYAHDPAISEDGRYIVFDGSVAGVNGVWRRPSSPGATLEQVAGGEAVLPSTSADGRYVSFTTRDGVRLAEISDGQIHTELGPPESPAVYVRDMSMPSSSPGAFTLVSAKDGSAEALSYEYNGANPQAEAERLGSTAAGRTAISADGRKVAFVTTALSDLAGPGTPPMEVAVRDLDTEETQLVSVRYDQATGSAAVDPETGGPEPIPERTESGTYGAVFSTGSPPPFELTEAHRVSQMAGASISADGTTVAWLGQQIPEQARILSAEEIPASYAEPLWRRIADGPSAATRRVTGGSDPENPACASRGETRLPAVPSVSDPCQGPFATQNTGSFGTWNHREAADVIPRLSGDGYDVAFIASAPLVGNAGGFGLGAGEYNDDLYWADMREPSRTAALRQLTQFASGEENRISTNAQIEDVGISSDGGQIAFVTKRTVFPLGAPAYVSVPAAIPGLLELYDVDLYDETLTRVSRGYEGETSEHPHPESNEEDAYPQAVDGALSPSFSAGGRLLSFSSTASNLVFGDGNTPSQTATSNFDDGADAFSIARVIFSAEPTPQSISPPPPNPAPQPPWALAVSAKSLPDGAVRLDVRPPGPGRLSVRAGVSLRVRHGGAGHGTRLLSRTVASAARTVGAGQGHLELILRLSARYGPLAARAGGQSAKVTVSFSAPGHPLLRRTITVRFKRSRHAKRGGAAR
jgi:hypothetical protein